jgi:zinc protease
VDSLDLAASMAFYRDRFADASDFTFVFVGSFSLDSIRPYVLTYLGSLPGVHRRENWRDVGITPPGGIVSREVRKGTEPKSETQVIFGGPFTWTRENRYALGSLADVMRIRLREVLREDLGGTYDVSVGATPQREPRQRYSVTIDFGSAPDRAGKLRDAVFAQIDSLARTGPTSDELEKVRETQRRSEETQLRENTYWLSALTAAEREGTDPRLILQGASLRSTLTSDLVRDAARRYLDVKNYIQVVLLPERAASAPERK